jgi:hypothetical protein
VSIATSKEKSSNNSDGSKDRQPQPASNCKPSVKTERSVRTRSIQHTQVAFGTSYGGQRKGRFSDCYSYLQQKSPRDAAVGRSSTHSQQET